MIGVPSVSTISNSGMRSPMLLPILKSMADVTGATVGEGAAGSSEPQAAASTTANAAKRIAEVFFGNCTIPSSSLRWVLGQIHSVPVLEVYQNRCHLLE